MSIHPSTITDSNTSAWTGLVAVEDTALHVTDTGGTGTPIVYLNGCRPAALAATDRRTQPRLPPHHFRRTSPRLVEQVCRLFLRSVPA